MEYLLNGKNKFIYYERNKMKQLKVLYEDNHIIVVEKPPNITSQGDKTNDENMLDIIKGYIT